MTPQKITLTSREHFGTRVPSQVLGWVLEWIAKVVRQSVRMSIEGCSRVKGRRPEWLRAAADIRFLGQEGEDRTILNFEAPKLGDALPHLYAQQEFWPTKPDPNDTGFDLVADVLRDVVTRNADSERFDRPLLNSLAGLRKVLDRTFTEMVLSVNHRSPSQQVIITPYVVEIARNLSTHTPRPRRVRVVGKLEVLRISTQRFGLVLDDGQEICGVLFQGDMQQLRPLLHQRVLVLGKAIYKPSGRLLRIEAEETTQTTDESSFFSTVPQPVPQYFDLQEELRAQQHKPGVDAVMGKWPGDETEEEIRQALKELS